MSKIKRFFGIEDKEEKQALQRKALEEVSEKKPLDANSPAAEKSKGISIAPTEKDNFYNGSFESPNGPLVTDTKFTIILLENTIAVAKEREALKKIVKSLVTSGFVAVINYGSAIRVLEKVEARDFNCDIILNEEDIGENACLSDALIVLERMVNHNYNVTEWCDFKKYRISSVEIIGIGRGIDNFSAVSSEKGIENFEKVLSRSNVVTKYFCLSEDNFIDVAAIGFRSIGAINRTYTK